MAHTATKEAMAGAPISGTKREHAAASPRNTSAPALKHHKSSELPTPTPPGHSPLVRPAPSADSPVEECAGLGTVQRRLLAVHVEHEKKQAADSAAAAAAKSPAMRRLEKDGAECLRSGWMSKQGSGTSKIFGKKRSSIFGKKNWKKRFFVLSDRGLHYFKSKGSAKVLGEVLWENLAAVNGSTVAAVDPAPPAVGDRPFCWALHTTTRGVFFMCCDDAAGRGEWTAECVRVLKLRKLQQSLGETNVRLRGASELGKMMMVPLSPPSSSRGLNARATDAGADEGGRKRASSKSKRPKSGVLVLPVPIILKSKPRPKSRPVSVTVPPLIETGEENSAADSDICDGTVDFDSACLPSPPSPNFDAATVEADVAAFKQRDVDAVDRTPRPDDETTGGGEAVVEGTTPTEELETCQPPILAVQEAAARRQSGTENNATAPAVATSTATCSAAAAAATAPVPPGISVPTFQFPQLAGL